jgi:hypothetical protein
VSLREQLISLFFDQGKSLSAKKTFIYKNKYPDLAEGFVLIPFGGFLLPVADFIWKLSSTKTDTRC